MTDGDRGPRGRKRHRLLWWLILPALGGAWLACSAMAYAASMRLYVIPTASMTPTLAPGDRVAASTRPTPLPRRGELWVFHMPQMQALAIKRVIGLPGETIEVASGRMLVDGQPLSEPYISVPPSYTMPPRTLGPDQYFMLGDNRNASNDSHIWGPLAAERLVGKVKYRCWPAGRLTGF